MFPTDRRYTRDHEWAQRENGRVRIGITSFAAERLSDIVFVELPKVGAEVRAGAAFGAIESVKAASDLYAPVSGSVVEVNQAVIDGPEALNQDPHGSAWMVVMEMSAPEEWDQLLDSEAYAALVGAEQA